MELPTSESQVLILKELHRADTVAYFRTDVNNLLARFDPRGFRSHKLRRHDGGNALKSQDHCEELRALPLKPMACGIFSIPSNTLRPIRHGLKGCGGRESLAAWGFPWYGVDMEHTPFELTPEQKGMLASLSHETGKPIPLLLTEAPAPQEAYK